MTIMAALEQARDAILALPEVATCKIGLEPNIGPDDYPLCRLVPSRITPGKPYGKHTVETLVYFGAQTAKSEGTEQVYADLFDMEAAILEALRTLGHRYVETITDEDRLDAYKLMVSRVEIAFTP